jgi:hypothetical protein
MIVRKRHYQQSIKLIRKEFGIRIKTDGKKSPLDSSSLCWVVPLQSIRLGTNDRPELVLLCLAHELGHCLSIRVGSMASMTDRLLYNQGAKLSVIQHWRIVQEERLAFRLGCKFLRDNDLPITPWMKRAKRVLMASHTSTHSLSSRK